MIIRTKLLKLNPFGKIIGMAIWPFIFIDPEYDNETLINHERIHLAQQKELFLIGFYVLYFIEYLLNRLSGMSHHKSYLMISFEIEAFTNQHNLEFLKKRNPYNWYGIRQRSIK